MPLILVVSAQIAVLRARVTSQRIQFPCNAPAHMIVFACIYTAHAHTHTH